MDKDTFAEEQPTREFMLRIAQMMNDPPEEYEEYAKMLEEKKLKTVKHLGYLSKEDLEKIGIPVGISSIIYKELEAITQKKDETPKITKADR